MRALPFNQICQRAYSPSASGRATETRPGRRLRTGGSDVIPPTPIISRPSLQRRPHAGVRPRPPPSSHAGHNRAARRRAVASLLPRPMSSLPSPPSNRHYLHGPNQKEQGGVGEESHREHPEHSGHKPGLLEGPVKGTGEGAAMVDRGTGRAKTSRRWGGGDGARRRRAKGRNKRQ